VHTPDITVEQPAITVEQPSINVQPPEVKVQVEPPNVSVNPEIHMPQAAPITKTVTFERDPLTDLVSKAEVTEG